MYLYPTISIYPVVHLRAHIAVSTSYQLSIRVVLRYAPFCTPTDLSIRSKRLFLQWQDNENDLR